MSGLRQLKTLIKNLKAIEPFILKEADRFVGRKAKLLTDLNRENLNSGIDSKGVELNFKKPRITPLTSTLSYTKEYARFKKSKGRQTSFVDLRLLGDFHKSITLTRLEQGWFTFTSGVDIFPYLVANYGTEILGVTEKQLQEFSTNELKPYLENKLIGKLLPR